jgi:drug/metabolite transporter (DMT)-like permease
MNNTINPRMTAPEWAMLVALSIIWGGSFFFVEVAIEEVAPLTLVATRVGGAAILLVAALWIRGNRLPGGLSLWLAFIFMGFLNNVVPFSLIAWGQIHLGAGVASILNATTPLFTVLVAHFATVDERMTPTRVAGLIIGFFGVTVMIGADTLAGSADQLLAQLAVLAASMSYALSAVYARRFRRFGVQPMTAAAGQMIGASLVMVPLALILDKPWTMAWPSAPVLGSLFGLAFLSTFVAYIIYYRILATAGSVNLMLVTFLVPVSAILLGALVLGERLSTNHFLGMAAIGLGLAAIDGRPLGLLRRA